jgi:hypothetical protein
VLYNATLYEEGNEVDTKCIALGIAMLVIGAGLGFAAGITLSSQASGNLAYELEIWDINWILEGDLFTIEIVVDNIGNMPNSVHSISVRRDAAGSTEYAWIDPISINNKNEIPSHAWDIFRWDVIRGNATIDFLQPGQIYVIKVVGYESAAQKTTTAPLGF